MPCDNEICQYLVIGGAPLTVIVDGQMRQFCGLSCIIIFLEELLERHVNS